MKTFKLNGKVTISVYTEVEAETLEEAIELTNNLDIVKGKWGQPGLKKRNWINDDYDGVVFDIELD